MKKIIHKVSRLAAGASVAVGLVLLPMVASAATWSCVRNADDDWDCSGSGFVYTFTNLSVSPTDNCGVGDVGAIHIDADGNVDSNTLDTTGESSPLDLSTTDQTGCVAASSNPHTWGNLIVGVVTAVLGFLTTMGTQLGLLLVGVLAVALGIYGAKVGWGLVTNFIRAKQN